MAKKFKIFPGDVFTFPIENGKIGLGVVSKVPLRRTSAIIGYFFNYILNSEVKFSELSLDISKVILIVNTTTMGFKDETWKIIPNFKCQEIANLPMPIFIHKDNIIESDNPYWFVEMNDDLHESTRYRVNISKEEASKYPQDGLAGHVWVEQRMTRLLRNAGLLPPASV